jgi:hypothetical protein
MLLWNFPAEAETEPVKGTRDGLRPKFPPHFGLMVSRALQIQFGTVLNSASLWSLLENLNICWVAVQCCGLDWWAEIIVMCVCVCVCLMCCSDAATDVAGVSNPEPVSVYQGVTVMSLLLALNTILVSAILCE